jgi:ubiquinone/menaquinone biosynthesis C-methylase UbiE
MRWADEDGRPGFAAGGAREIARAYDVAAPSFDRHRALPDGVAEAIRTAVMAAVGGVPRPRLLDIGAGAGRIGWPFVAAGDDYIGVDFSFGMLREFTGRAERNGARARLVQADGERLPLADASLDAVLLMQVLSAARDRRRLIAEAGRVLKPAGCLIFGRTVAPDNGIDACMRQHLAGSLDAAGVHPYRRKWSDDALSWLAGNAHDSRTVTAAAWAAERTPRAFLERHATGARFSVLPPPVQNIAMLRLREWAVATFGSLDAVSVEPYRFDLMIYRLRPGIVH